MIDYLSLEHRILDLISERSFTATVGALQNQRIVLGGVRGSGGGEGGPIQAFVGKLAQQYVTFDTDEFATIAIPSGENASLIDNLNRIRYGETIRPVYTPINYTVPSGMMSNLNDHLEGIDAAIPSGGGGGTSWPFGEVWTIGAGADADYPTLAAAIADVPPAGTLLLCDAGTHACNGITLPAGVHLGGWGREVTFLVTTGGDSSIIIPAGHGGLLTNFTLKNIDDNAAAENIGMECTAFGAANFRVKDVRFWIQNGGAGGSAIGLDCTSNNTVTLYDCDMLSIAASNAYGINDDALGTIVVQGGDVEPTSTGGGNAYSVQLSASGQIALANLPLLQGGINGAGAVVGDYANPAGGMFMFSSDFIDSPERAAPANPAAGRWRLYFKSDGAYVLDDAGNEVGPLGVGGGGYPGSVVTVDPTDVDADYSTIAAAVTGTGAGDWIFVWPGTYTEDVVAANRNFFLIPGAVADGYWSLSGTCSVYGGDFNQKSITLAASGTYDLHDVINVFLVANESAEIFGGKFIDTSFSIDIEPDRDTYVYDGIPDFNYGAQTALLLGNSSGNLSRALLHFDLSAVPLPITGATFYFRTSNLVNGNFQVGAYRILAANTAWVEGTKQGDVEVGSPCWNKRVYNTANWAGSVGLGTSGTDYNGTALGTAPQAWATFTWYNFALTAAEVEKLRNGAYTNAGILFRGVAEALDNYITIYSNNWSDTSYLRVTGGASSMTIAAGKTVTFHNLPTVATISGTGIAVGSYQNASGNLRETSALDVFPDNAGRGLFTRLVNVVGIGSYTDHFRSGVIPTGYSWQGAPFVGTPSGLVQYNMLADYLRAYQNTATRSYLAKTTGAALGMYLVIRGSTIQVGGMGVRIDDGTDSNYYEAYLEPVAGGLAQVTLRENVSGGGATVVGSSATFLGSTSIVLKLLCYAPAPPQHRGIMYILPEVLDYAVASSTVVNWVPSRYGIFGPVTGGWSYIVADWFQVG